MQTRSLLLRGCLLALLLACPPLRAAPAPTSTPSTQPARKLSDADRRRLLNLSQQAIDHARAGRLEQAETALLAALAIRPNVEINLYNMACIKALRNQPDVALDYLYHAVEAGYDEFDEIEKDPDLASLRNLPRYQRLIERKAEYQKRAADATLNWLKGELSEGYLFEVDPAHKLIFAVSADAQALADLRNWLTRQAETQWHDLFSRKPTRYVCVVLPTPADFRKIVTQPGAGGVYNHDLRVLVAQRLGQVVTHEFTHALHAADLDTLSQEHAPWVSEGLATLYEPGRMENDRLVPADHQRLAEIQAAARARRLIPLDRLLRMTQQNFLQDPTRAYGQSGSVMLYLYEQNLLRPFYDACKATYAQDKTGRLALERATGRTLAQFERDWIAWMLLRTPPPRDTGENGPVIGVRFGTAIDGLRIASIVPNGPAARAGLRAGDIIVGIDDQDVRDQATFVPLLARRAVGDTINLKIRRKDQYLDFPVTLAPRNAPPRPASRP